MTVVMYGIKNCDTIKKARNWLQDNDIKFDFHDYKASGAAREDLEKWVESLGWEKVLNRAGTTFRKLADEDKADLDAAKAIDLMLAQPSMIKRPLLDVDGAYTAGFKADIYAQIFSK